MKKLIALLLSSVAAYALDVTVSWNSSPPSENVTQWRIYSSPSAFGQFTLVGTSAATNFVTAIPDGTATFFVVTAVNDFGESLPSAAASMTSTNVPAAPTGIAVVHPFTLSNVITITINANAERK